MAPLPPHFIRAIVAAIAPAITQRLTVAMMRSPTFNRLVAQSVHYIDHLPAKLTEGKPIPKFKPPPIAEYEPVEHKLTHQEDFGEPHDMEDPFSPGPKKIEDAKPEFRRAFRRAGTEETPDAAQRPSASRLASKKKATPPPPDDSDWYNKMRRLQDKMRDE